MDHALLYDADRVSPAQWVKSKWRIECCQEFGENLQEIGKRAAFLRIIAVFTALVFWANGNLRDSGVHQVGGMLERVDQFRPRANGRLIQGFCQANRPAENVFRSRRGIHEQGAVGGDATADSLDPPTIGVNADRFRPQPAKLVPILP